MMPPVSGWFTVRVLQALCAALALLVSPGLQLAHAHTVSDPRAPSVRASAGGGRVVDEGSRPTPPARTARPLAALAGQGGGRRRAAARQRGEQRPGEASKHPLWLYHCEHEALVWFELDTLGNVRRLRGAQRFFAGAISSPPPDPLPEPPLPLPTDLGGYKYTAFGRLLPPDAGTPTPTALGQALSQPMRWQGRWFEEETGLYDFRNRVWSPELGASLSPDEFGFFHTEGTLWSWPGQNPIRWRDPTGRFGDETIVLMHHPEPVPAGLPPGPPSGVFVGVGASATFTGAVSVGAGQFFGAATPDAAYRSVGIGVGILPAAGAGVQVGWFAGTAEEFNQAQSLFLGIGSGVGVEGALIFGPNGSFGASLAPQLVWGSPLWGGTILGGEGKVVCE